jgi:hypothetical protein
MGFYSYTCAKTHLPVLNFHSCRDKEMYTVVVLFPNGDKVTGEYDGYGRVSGVENIYPDIDEGRLKWILKKFYNGEGFNDVGLSHHDPGQGHFHDIPKLKEAFAKGGFKSYEDFLTWYNDLSQ